MTDADAARTQALRVLIRENELLTLGTIQSDILSAARVVGLSVWLGHAVLDPDDPRDDLLSSEALEGLMVRRIKYGSPLTVVSRAVSSTPTLFALMRGIGQLRRDFAKAGESKAKRDLAYEQAATTRPERRSREYQERIDRLREVAESFRPELSHEDMPDRSPDQPGDAQACATAGLAGCPIRVVSVGRRARSRRGSARTNCPELRCAPTVPYSPVLAPAPAAPSASAA